MDAYRALGSTGIREFKVAAKPGLRAILYVQQPIPTTARYIIIPTRVFVALPRTLNRESLRLHPVASRQAKNLIRKVAMLSAFFPGGRNYSTDFSVGRLLVIRSDGIPEERAWEFAGTVIARAEQTLDLRAISQPDYDQRMYQHTFARYYDALPLQAIHDPTARGTILAFAAACELSELRLSESKLGILGMGNLGSRIASRLLLMGVPHIIIYDTDKSRLLQYHNQKGYQIVTSDSQLCEAGPRALILSAHSGSLSRAFARTISRTKEVRVVGGPEAGLDGDISAVRIIERAGLHFVPSMLCGALGLAATLEESVGASIHLPNMEARLVGFLARVAREAAASGTLFHQAFRHIISSGQDTEVISR